MDQGLKKTIINHCIGLIIISFVTLRNILFHCYLLNSYILADGIINCVKSKPSMHQPHQFLASLWQFEYFCIINNNRER